MVRTLTFPVVFLASLLSGGGTVVNFVQQDHDKTFGGVQQDMDFIDQLVNADSPIMSTGSGGSPWMVVLVVAPFVDLPLSILGDTLTFPIARWLDDQRVPRRLAPPPLVNPEPDRSNPDQNTEK